LFAPLLHYDWMELNIIVYCCRFALCRVCVSLCCPRLALRSSETPRCRRSADRTTVVPIRHFRFLKCWYSAFRVSDLGNKRMSLSHQRVPV